MKNFTNALDESVKAVTVKKNMALICIKPGMYLIAVGGKRALIRFAHAVVWSGGERFPFHFIRDTEFEPDGHDDGIMLSVDLKRAEMLIALKQAQFSTTALAGSRVIERAVVVGGSDEGAMAVYYDSRLPKPFSFQLVRGQADAERLAHQGLWHMIEHDPESLPKEWNLQQLCDEDEV